MKQHPISLKRRAVVGTATAIATLLAAATVATSTIVSAAVTTTSSMPCSDALCTMDAGLNSPACAAAGVPSNVLRGFEQAGRLVAAAATRPPAAARRLRRRARVVLRRADADAARAANATRPKTSRECASALRDAAARVALVLADCSMTPIAAGGGEAGAAAGPDCPPPPVRRAHLAAA